MQNQIYNNRFCNDLNVHYHDREKGLRFKKIGEMCFVDYEDLQEMMNSIKSYFIKFYKGKK